MEVFQRLLAQHGPQNWWPSDGPFETMVGAILTQNVGWRNVQQAIDNLKAADALDPRAIVAAEEVQLTGWLRPSGHYNVKARRLRNFCRWYLDKGELAGLQATETATLREELLAVNGVGRETADNILLYVLERPVFVVDSYTRRLFSRLGQVPEKIAYEPLRAHFESRLPRDVALFNEYHALIDHHGNRICRPTRPLCGECGLRDLCPSARAL